jgi:phosphoglycerate-specific signal transduction histidine kinase
MNAQRYAAYRSLVNELSEWRTAHALEERAHDDLRDAAEGLLLAREGDEAEEPLARASTTVLGMLALDELDEQNASWLLDALLSCGPRIPQPIGDAA